MGHHLTAFGEGDDRGMVAKEGRWANKGQKGSRRVMLDSVNVYSVRPPFTNRVQKEELRSTRKHFFCARRLQPSPPHLFSLPDHGAQVLDDSGALVAVQSVGAQPHGDVHVLVRGACHQVQEPHGVVEASTHAAPQEVLATRNKVHAVWLLSRPAGTRNSKSSSSIVPVMGAQQRVQRSAGEARGSSTPSPLQPLADSHKPHVRSSARISMLHASTKGAQPMN